VPKVYNIIKLHCNLCHETLIIVESSSLGNSFYSLATFALIPVNAFSDLVLHGLAFQLQVLTKVSWHFIYNCPSRNLPASKASLSSFELQFVDLFCVRSKSLYSFDIIFNITWWFFCAFGLIKAQLPLRIRL
jgi:hypothetical protein